MKKTLSLVLALALCLALAVPALASTNNIEDNDVRYAATGGNIYFRSRTNTITGCDVSVARAVIPGEINGTPVYSIYGDDFSWNGAFCDCTNLSSIVISDSVVSIGKYAFYGCSSLTDVTLPNDLSSINAFVFNSCTSLAQITIPDSVLSIGDNAFGGCTTLGKITIPANVRSIGSEAFYNCPTLSRVTILNPEITIGEWAFQRCSKLSDVYFNGSEAQWNALSIGSNNDPLRNANIHFNSTGPDAADPTPAAPEHTHTLTYTAAKAATCTESGNLQYWYCADCGKYFSDAGATVETTLAALTLAPLGHNYVNGVCTRDGAIDPNYTAPTPDPEPSSDPAPGETHTHNLIYTAARTPTCTEGGNLQYWYCADCGKYFSDANGVIETTLANLMRNALGHNYVNGVCTRCGEAEPGYVRPLTPSNVHFQKSTLYYQGQFEDVPANQWYTNSVAEAVELGLMKGNGDGSFNPSGDVTLAEAITMAARIHSIYTTGTENFGTGSPWWQPYLDYAYINGVINWAYYNADVSQKATRAQFAEIFANALPAEALTVMNSVKDDAIPDVPMSAAYAEYVYRLYRAGILVGSDANGTFYAQTYITRAEAAAIVSRMAESNNRVSLTLG